MSQSILNRLAFARNIAPCFLSVCGVGDYSKELGKILYMFNIEDEQHPDFKSTIAVTLFCNSGEIKFNK